MHCFKYIKINILSQPSESLILNHIGNVWAGVKRYEYKSTPNAMSNTKKLCKMEYSVITLYIRVCNVSP